MHTHAHKNAWLICTACHMLTVSPHCHYADEGSRRLPHSLANNVTVPWGHVLSGNFQFLALGLWAHSPDKPPAFKILLDDLHDDSFIKADFILPLTGVWLDCYIFLLCIEKEWRTEWLSLMLASLRSATHWFSLYLSESLRRKSRVWPTLNDLFSFQNNLHHSTSAPLFLPNSDVFPFTTVQAFWTTTQY